MWKPERSAPPVCARRKSRSYRRLEDVGVTHLWTMPWLFYGGSGASLADKKVGFERFSEDVIAKFR